MKMTTKNDATDTEQTLSTLKWRLNKAITVEDVQDLLEKKLSARMKHDSFYLTKKRMTQLQPKKKP